MAPSPRPWSIAFVEDDDDMRRQVKEFLEGEDFEFGKVEVTAIESFESALGLLRERKIDIVILDVFRGRTSQDDKAGIEVLNNWRATGFAPVILHTALPEGLEEHCNVFVRLVPKEGGSLLRLAKEIEELFSLKIPQVHRAIFDHLEASLRDYMWRFVVANWEKIGGLVPRPDFARLLVHRLGLQFGRIGVGAVIEQLYPGIPGGDPDPQKVHPAEYYIKPSFDGDPSLGDLRFIKRNERDDLYVVVWPSCDLVQRGGKCKVDRALCARALPISELEEYKKWVENPTSGATKSLVELMSNRRKGSHQPERYHFLPAVWDIPAVVIDFQQLEHVAVDELRDARCLATVASPFAESIGARFIRYLGRLGTPDLDTALALEAIHPAGKPDEVPL
jgi:CheY-like chemotaxis protein